MNGNVHLAQQASKVRNICLERIKKEMSFIIHLIINEALNSLIHTKTLIDDVIMSHLTKVLSHPYLLKIYCTFLIIFF